MADYKQYEEYFDEASAKYGVSKSLLLGVAKTESNFDSKATSNKGAKGIMQLMDDTAKSLGVKDSYNPQENIMGGAKYLSQLLQKYDGDTDKALASYFAGSGNVSKYGAEKYSTYYNKVYKNMDSLNVSDDSTGSFVNLGIKDKAENGIEKVVNIVVIILVVILAVVFIALSIGQATGTTSKVTSSLKAIKKAKKGDIKGAVSEVADDVAGEVMEQ